MHLFPLYKVRLFFQVSRGSSAQLVAGEWAPWGLLWTCAVQEFVSTRWASLQIITAIPALIKGEQEGRQGWRQESREGGMQADPKEEVGRESGQRRKWECGSVRNWNNRKIIIDLEERGIMLCSSIIIWRAREGSSTACFIKQSSPFLPRLDCTEEIH